MECFAGNKSLQLARYPNLKLDGSDRYHGAWLHVDYVQNSSSGLFHINGSDSQLFKRALEWQKHGGNSTWMHGYWGFDWAENHVHIESIRLANSSLLVQVDRKTPPNYPMRANARWYAENLLSELDLSSEYWVSRQISSDILPFVP